MTTRAVVLHGEEYLPELETAGPHHCQIFKNSPMEGSESARLMYLLSITAAERSIKVGNGYFVPDDLTTETLVAAVERGVSIEVLVPGNISTRAWSAARAGHRWGCLFERGGRIFVSPQMHIIDGLWTLGRLGELRQPFLPVERRSEPQHHRPRDCCRRDARL